MFRQDPTQLRRRLARGPFNNRLLLAPLVAVDVMASQHCNPSKSHIKRMRARRNNQLVPNVSARQQVLPPYQPDDDPWQQGEQRPPNRP